MDNKEIDLRKLNQKEILKILEKNANDAHIIRYIYSQTHDKELVKKYYNNYKSIYTRGHNKNESNKNS